MTIHQQIADAVLAVDFGKPTARKGGRNPKFPFLPVVVHPEGGVALGAKRQETILGLAYATRDEAVACAERTINLRRANLAVALADPCKRALREHHGLPRELP